MKTHLDLPCERPRVDFGKLRRRNFFSALLRIFQIKASAFATFLYRFAASVPSRTAASGDSTGFVVRRCVQWSFGKR
jgi:hypothetical protein